LVAETLQHVAVLHITLLGQGEPGAVITRGGDLDNRLKTLFDALRVPSNEQELPRVASPQAGEDPFYCVLQDDKLINGIAVTNDRLLRTTKNADDVVLMIHVLPEPTYSTIGSVNWISI
jgi:hypothetical protein